MPVDLPEEEESVGPLDVTKAAGYEDGINPPSGGNQNHHKDTELLDARPSASDPYSNSADAYERKNPLGYTVTPVTGDEIEAAEVTDDLRPPVVA